MTRICIEITGVGDAPIQMSHGCDISVEATPARSGCGELACTVASSRQAIAPVVPNVSACLNGEAKIELCDQRRDRTMHQPEKHGQSAGSNLTHRKRRKALNAKLLLQSGQRRIREPCTLS